jgi:hypothetical protein
MSKLKQSSKLAIANVHGQPNEPYSKMDLQ